MKINVYMFCIVQLQSSENSVGIRRNFPNKQFPFSHSVFYPFRELVNHHFHQILNDHLKTLSVWKSLKICSLGKGLTLTHTILSPTQSQILTTLGKKPFEYIIGKEENAGNQHFLLFPPCFYLSKYNFQFFSHIYFVNCKFFHFGPV